MCTKKKLIKNTESKEKIKDPNDPEIVLLGLIDVNFFHLKIFPNIYPPTSEQIVIVISHVNSTNDERVSFLK